MTYKNKLLLGGHVSISQGIEKVFEKGESIGCTAIQIFTKSNRQWKAKEINDNTAHNFKNSFKKSSIKHIVVHASYLINIGSSNKDLNENSTLALIDELERCKKLDIPYLILHSGSYQKSSEKECLNLISEKINEALQKVTGSITILIENMSGMGTSVGYKFEQLAYIYDKIKEKNRIGICIDTCHAFAAGYDFRTKIGYDNMWKEFDSTIGLTSLKAIHINDSKKDCGSKIDRHEFIGKGKIGIEAFKMLFNDDRFFAIPKILETPIEEFSEYVPDIKTIVNLISSNNQNLIIDTPLEQYLIKKERN